MVVQDKSPDSLDSIQVWHYSDTLIHKKVKVTAKKKLWLTKIMGDKQGQRSIEMDVKNS